MRGVGGVTAQEQHRHVVLATALVDDLAESVGQPLQVLRTVGHGRGEQPHAVVEVRSREFHHAVGVEDHRLARVQVDGADRVLEPPELGGEPQRQPAVHGQLATTAVHVPESGVDVPGPDQLNHSGGQVGLGVGAGGEAVGVEFVEEDGGPRHHRGRAVALGGVGAQHDPELAHDGRRVRVVPLHVADDGTDPAAGKRDDVVPVAADVAAQPGGAVADGDRAPGTSGIRRGSIACWRPSARSCSCS